MSQPLAWSVSSSHSLQFIILATGYRERVWGLASPEQEQTRSSSCVRLAPGVALCMCAFSWPQHLLQVQLSALNAAGKTDGDLNVALCTHRSYE